MMVCERGTMFGYSDLIVDPRNFPLMRDAGCPVTADVTHALQQPAGKPLEVSRVPLSSDPLSSDMWSSKVDILRGWVWVGLIPLQKHVPLTPQPLEKALWPT